LVRKQLQKFMTEFDAEVTHGTPARPAPRIRGGGGGPDTEPSGRGAP
jgi:hypothetical protein